MLKNAMDAAEILGEQGIETTILRLLTVKPLPVKAVVAQMATNAPVIVVEEMSANCGVRDALAFELRKLCPECRIDGLDLGSKFVPHGSMDKLYEHCGLNNKQIAKFPGKIKEKFYKWFTN